MWMRNLQINKPSKGNSHDKAGSSLQSKAMSRRPNSPPKANSLINYRSSGTMNVKRSSFFSLIFWRVCMHQYDGRVWILLKVAVYL